MEHLPASSLRRIRSLFESHSQFSDITPTQYSAAYSWLTENGILATADGPTAGKTDPRIAVFRGAIKNALWLPDADVLVGSAEEVPDDARRAARAVGLSAEDALAEIRHAWGKLDTTMRAHLGVVGEQVLVGLLSSIEDADVRHVSQESDCYGYDIALTTPTVTSHLEVKTTNRRGRLIIHISRNEFQTMLHDPTWVLVAVRLGTDQRPAAVATVDRGWIKEVAPVDKCRNATWESARIEIPLERLTPGIPDITAEVPGDIPDILKGYPPWPGR